MIDDFSLDLIWTWHTYIYIPYPLNWTFFAAFPFFHFFLPRLACPLVTCYAIPHFAAVFFFLPLITLTWASLFGGASLAISLIDISLSFPFVTSRLASFRFVSSTAISGSSAFCHFLQQYSHSCFVFAFVPLSAIIHVHDLLHLHYRRKNCLPFAPSPPSQKQTCQPSTCFKINRSTGFPFHTSFALSALPCPGLVRFQQDWSWTGFFPTSPFMISGLLLPGFALRFSPSSSSTDFDANSQNCE